MGGRDGRIGAAGFRIGMGVGGREGENCVEEGEDFGTVEAFFGFGEGGFGAEERHCFGVWVMSYHC